MWYAIGRKGMIVLIVALEYLSQWNVGDSSTWTCACERKEDCTYKLSLISSDKH